MRVYDVDNMTGPELDAHTAALRLRADLEKMTRSRNGWRMATIWCLVGSFLATPLIRWWFFG